MIFFSACDKMPLLAPGGSVITIFPAATTVPLNGQVEIIATVIENGTTQTPTDPGTGNGGTGTRRWHGHGHRNNEPDDHHDLDQRSRYASSERHPRHLYDDYRTN